MSSRIFSNEAVYEEASVDAFVIEAWKQKGNDILGFKMPPARLLEHINDRCSHLPKGPEAIIQPTTPKIPKIQTTATKLQYGKVYYITPDQGESRDLLVIEYKAADKLAPEVVKGGLYDMEI